MTEYWDQRFQTEGMIWGDTPSKTAFHALELFRQHKVGTILVPGSGYGRNSRLFSTSGFDVTGIEISPAACEMASHFDPQTKCLNSSIFDFQWEKDAFDAVYCFSVLHLFREKDRRTFIENCIDCVRPNGLLFFAVMSELDPSCGKGIEIEKSTFESKPGRPVHYFDESDIKHHFSAIDILETGLSEDSENHGEGPHVHILRYIVCVNK